MSGESRTGLSMSPSTSRHDPGTLVADACPHGRRRIRDLLNGVGLRRIYEAEDPGGAVRLFQQAGPALLVVDWDLDRGAELIRLAQARKAEERAQPPIVVTIEQPTRRQVEKILALGVTNIVVKPYSAKLMRSRLEQVRGASQA